MEPVPSNGGKIQISTDGGHQASWRGDGRELVYRSLDDRIMAVPVKIGTTFERGGAAQPLFQARMPGQLTRNAYVPSIDGQPFLVVARVQKESLATMTVVVNWLATVKT